MAKTARKRPTTRSASGRASQQQAPRDGGQSADDAPGTGERILERLTAVLYQAALLGRHHPLGRLCVAYMLQTLEWQSMFLEIYQRMLRDGVLDSPTNEQLRGIARSMMTAYLDLAKSAPERRERLLMGQTELARALFEAIEDMRERLATPSP